MNSSKKSTDVSTHSRSYFQEFLGIVDGFYCWLTSLSTRPDDLTVRRRWPRRLAVSERRYDHDRECEALPIADPWIATPNGVE
jgi:hypothetical protein